MSALGMLLHSLNLKPLAELPVGAKVVAPRSHSSQCSLCGGDTHIIGYYQDELANCYRAFTQCKDDACVVHEEELFQQGWDRE